MLLSDIMDTIKAEVLTGEETETLKGINIHNACGSDMMSDVLAYVKDQSLLLTGLVNLQVVRTAEMMDILAICFVRGKTPPENLIELAKELGIVVLKTEFPMYTACGRLYVKGLEGRKDAEAL